VFGQDKSALLERSWILINTSTHECLPVSFIEACAHRCAILSFVDANHFASRFGRHVREDGVEALADGLDYLLENDRWRTLGQKGYEYVRRHHETKLVVSTLIEIYQSLSH
jgi:glycosyltransferase involved in cell wall biosynthesis